MALLHKVKTFTTLLNFAMKKKPVILMLNGCFLLQIMISLLVMELAVQSKD